MEPMEFKIPATDLTFEWSNCNACFWAKHRLKWKKPYTPFPSVFGVIDKVMRSYWEGQLAYEVDNSLPTIALKTKAKQLLSKPIVFNVEVEEHKEQVVRRLSTNQFGQEIAITTCVGTLLSAKYTQPVHIQLSGSLDMMGQGEVTGLVADGKTTAGMTPEKAMFYAPQLWTYRHCLENPAKGDAIPSINHLGLIVLEPKRMVSRTLMEVSQTYFPLPTEGLLPFLREVATVLAGPEPANKECPWCKIRHAQN